MRHFLAKAYTKLILKNGLKPIPIEGLQKKLQLKNGLKPNPIEYLQKI
jgi:hypothetical protein